ncbi:MAG: alpha/beta hydrolase [Gammaproteobacteria bacterium]|nr:MAG: alpha/beta hydrolase [Gammaproteobacteria bacterium]
MASDALREMSAMIRAAYAENPVGEGDLETMRASMEEQQGAIPLPDDVTRDDVDMAGVPGCRIQAPGVRNDRAVLYLHGGGYVMGSLDTHQELMGRISRQLNVTVYGVDYRLAPEHPWPAAVDDAVAAWDWLRASGITSDQAVVAGDSAGGGLSVALLMALREQDKPMPAGAVLFSPWSDLTGSGESIASRAEADPMIGPDMLKPMAARYHGDNPADLPSISPLFGDLAGLPPLLIQVGDAEILLDDSTRLHERAQAAGTSSTLHVFEEAFHVFQIMPTLPEAAEALEEMAEFCERVVVET